MYRNGDSLSTVNKTKKITHQKPQNTTGGKLLYLEGVSKAHFSHEWSNRWQWWCHICLTVFSLSYDETTPFSRHYIIDECTETIVFQLSTKPKRKQTKNHKTGAPPQTNFEIYWKHNNPAIKPNSNQIRHLWCMYKPLPFIANEYPNN